MSTRGQGYLEPLLAALRRRRANRLIPPAHRAHAMLDIGCGQIPTFLLQTSFARKFGVDQLITPGHVMNDYTRHLQLHHLDINRDPHLPFADGMFHVVTMLAVFEHIAKPQLPPLLNEIDRVLAPTGCFIMTTPAGWTAPILDFLKSIGGVSAEEIDEHQDSYSPAKLRSILNRTRLASYQSRIGHFELGMNVYARLTKPG